MVSRYTLEEMDENSQIVAYLFLMKTNEMSLSAKLMGAFSTVT